MNTIVIGSFLLTESFEQPWSHEWLHQPGVSVLKKTKKSLTSLSSTTLPFSRLILTSRVLSGLIDGRFKLIVNRIKAKQIKRTVKNDEIRMNTSFFTII